MNSLLETLLMSATAFLGATVLAQTNIITFETLPDGSRLSGGTVIANQFLASHGVRFQFEDGSYPLIRIVGGNVNGRPTAFRGWPNGSGDNTPAPGQNIGTRFLTDDSEVGAPPAPLIVSYVRPVDSASGYILDIDFDEAWDVEARTAANEVVARVHLQAGTPLTGDGIATPWSFRRPTADIQSIRIRYTGDTNANVGLAFDNFSPARALPVPAKPGLGLVLDGSLASLTVTGTGSAVYRIDESDDLSATNWTPVTSIVLDPSAAFTVTNLPVTTVLQRFYRAVGIP